MNEPVIEIRDLWFSYNGQPVLTAADLTVREGDFMAVIGPNGGGKTTLIRLMLGLLKPRRGTVRVLGLPPDKAAPLTGYMPQRPGHNQGFPVSVMDVVLMGRPRSGLTRLRYARADREAAQRALERMDMWPLRDRRVGELSGGQRQRVYVARALVSEPRVMFLDEPMANVDAQGQTEFYELMKELNRSVTIVMVSHDLMAVSSYVKSVACVSRQVHFHDRPEVTESMLKMAYSCPVELVAHGLPHRVLEIHPDD